MKDHKDLVDWDAEYQSFLILTIAIKISIFVKQSYNQLKYQYFSNMNQNSNKKKQFVKGCRVSR